MTEHANDNREVLLIEDDEEIISSLTSLVRVELSMSITAARDGSEGLRMALAGDYALVIIDANLPSKHGFDICRDLRAAKPLQAILFLTGRREELDKVLGLELGADDYVTKPYAPRELAARMKALLRRATRAATLSEAQPIIEIAGLKIDTASRRVWIEESPVELTLIEYELLTLLASNPGRTFERTELLEMVLGYSTGVHDHALTVHFSRIRSKIEADPNNPKRLKTVRGVGYRFAAADED